MKNWFKIFLMAIFLIVGGWFFVPKNVKADAFTSFSGWLFGAGGIYSNYLISTLTWIDPIVVDNASPNGLVTTTGTISLSTPNTLVVASAIGWNVGMGINITGAGAAGAALITSVTAISGTTFTINTAASTAVTNVTIYHDETAALTAACTSGNNIHLSSGVYNVTSAISCNGTFRLMGDGATDIEGGAFTVGTNPSIIMNRGTTNNIIDLETHGATINYPQFENFSIQQASGVTPTAGYGIIIVGSSGTAHMHGVLVRNFSILGTWGDISIGDGVGTPSNLGVSWFEDGNMTYVGSSTSSQGIFFNDSLPFGDNWFNNIRIVAINLSSYDLHIVAGDTNAFNSMKLGQALHGLVIDDSNTESATTRGIRFTDLSCEDSNSTSGNIGCVDISSTGFNTVFNIKFVGLECDPASNKACAEIDNYAYNITFDSPEIHGTGSGSGGIALKSSYGNVSITNAACSDLGYCVTTSGSATTNNISVVGTVCDPTNMTTCIQNNANIKSIYDEHCANNSCSVGIGTFSPPASLDVLGTISPLALFNGGNIGVGSTLPGALFDVKGNPRIVNGVQLRSQSAAPTCSDNTTCTINSGSTDEAGSGTTGASAGASITVTFGDSHSTAPQYCSILTNTSESLPAYVSSISSSTVTFNINVASSLSFYYNCQWGQP